MVEDYHEPKASHPSVLEHFRAICVWLPVDLLVNVLKHVTASGMMRWHLTKEAATSTLSSPLQSSSPSCSFSAAPDKKAMTEKDDDVVALLNDALGAPARGMLRLYLEEQRRRNDVGGDCVHQSKAKPVCIWQHVSFQREQRVRPTQERSEGRDNNVIITLEFASAPRLEPRFSDDDDEYDSGAVEIAPHAARKYGQEPNPTRLSPKLPRTISSSVSAPVVISSSRSTSTTDSRMEIDENNDSCSSNDSRDSYSSLRVEPSPKKRSRSVAFSEAATAPVNSGTDNEEKGADMLRQEEDNEAADDSHPKKKHGSSSEDEDERLRTKTTLKKKRRTSSQFKHQLLTAKLVALGPKAKLDGWKIKQVQDFSATDGAIGTVSITTAYRALKDALAAQTSQKQAAISA